MPINTAFIIQSSMPFNVIIKRLSVTSLKRQKIKHCIIYYHQFRNYFFQISDLKVTYYHCQIHVAKSADLCKSTF